MKFFWKVFFTTMFISTICVTMSGYILIRSSFETQLDNEVKTSQDYGEIVYYSLANGIGTYSSGEENGNVSLPQIAQAIRIDGLDQKIAFGVVDTGGQTLFSSLGLVLDKTMLEGLTGDAAGWVLKELEGRFYVQTMRPVSYMEDLFYIETVRDVTHVFRTQKVQYETMIKVLAAMILFACFLTFMISKMLLRRITALTETTKMISGGNLGERAVVSGMDEITLLSQNFNQMADRLEEKIYELEDEAQRKELFVGAFSHELKTPLTSIIGFSDLLRCKELDAGQRRICADYIFYEGKRLEKLSMRLLDLIVLKQHTLAPKPAEIKRVMEEVALLMKTQLREADIELLFDVEQAVIPMETELMKTVFINLIDNARKAIDGPGKIILTGKKHPGEYVVSVQDSGKGMKQQELPRITDAFYMVNKSRSREQGGAGLGLAICNEILMLHGFNISFDSAVGVGTVVTVTMREGTA